LDKSTEDQLSDAAKECDKLYAKSDRYLSMILNAHGSGGWIKLGKEGIALSNAKLFSKFTSSVTIIYIITCEAAAVSDEYPEAYNGPKMCSAIASYARAHVYASEDTQRAPPWHMAKGYIDDWEGTVLTWGPDGNRL
jgi:hypothetical protein